MRINYFGPLYFQDCLNRIKWSASSRKGKESTVSLIILLEREENVAGISRQSDYQRKVRDGKFPWLSCNLNFHAAGRNCFVRVIKLAKNKQGLVVAGCNCVKSRDAGFSGQQTDTLYSGPLSAGNREILTRHFLAGQRSQARFVFSKKFAAPSPFESTNNFLPLDNRISLWTSLRL